MNVNFGLRGGDRMMPSGDQFPGQFAAGNESLPERKYRDPVGTSTPRSELARERKGSIPIS